MSEPILRLVRRQLRQMSPDARVELDQIKSVLLQEVLKRDVIEGEKAEDTRKRVTRVNKARRAKVVEVAGAPLRMLTPQLPERPSNLNPGPLSGNLVPEPGWRG